MPNLFFSTAIFYIILAQYLIDLEAQRGSKLRVQEAQISIDLNKVKFLVNFPNNLGVEILVRRGWNIFRKGEISEMGGLILKGGVPNPFHTMIWEPE